MLHELIFVLSGFPSDVFVPYPPAPEPASTFRVRPDFGSLHRAERESLDRLGQLGWVYGQLQEFMTTNTEGEGVYTQALMAALETTLDEYRRAVLELERRILNKDLEAGQGIVPVAALVSELGQWELLLPSLWRFVSRPVCDVLLKKKEPYRLLDVVMDEARTGHLEYKVVMERIRQQLYDVLYRQLTAWMVYGQTSSDFFVVRDEQPSSTRWQRQYRLIKERVPRVLSRSTCESILFVGKAVANVQALGGRIPEDMKQSHLCLLLELHQRPAFEDDDDDQISLLIDQYQHREQRKLEQAVQQIRRSTADWLFQRILVGEHGLRRYLESFRNMFLLGYGDLAANFIAACAKRRPIKHHGRAAKAEQQEPTATIAAAAIFRQQELNALLAKASVGTEAEDGLSGYKLLAPPQGDRDGMPRFSDLLLADTCCVLTFELQWPIDLFLGSLDVSQYSELWCFLIALRYVQMALGGLWQSLRGSGSADAFHERAVWRLRSQMLYWVGTMWGHIQANVLSPHYQRLIESISLSTTEAGKEKAPYKVDFEELQRAHASFLQRVREGCLLVSAECSESIHRLLTLCLDFCQFVEERLPGRQSKKRRKVQKTKTAAEIVREWTQSFADKDDDEDDWTREVNRFEEEFTRISEKFFHLVSKQPPNLKTSGNLDILLMQLDYNTWYTGNRLYISR